MSLITSHVVSWLRELRTSGIVASPKLTPHESAIVGESFANHQESIRRLASRYYGSRCSAVADAVDWLTSEVYTYVIESVIAGKRSIPLTDRQWCAVAKTIRHRYHASRRIVVDGMPTAFLGDRDTSVATRLNADRLQLDDDAFIRVMSRYVALGLGRDVAPDWAVETIIHWVDAPEVSWADRAAELGISRETVKDRERKTKAAVRAGILGDLVSFEA